MSRPIAAIVLAAGQSKRMGQAKMLLPWHGSTVLGQVISCFATAGLDEILVVTGAERERVTALVDQLAQAYPVRAIHNPAFEAGEMLSSIQCGLAQLSSGVQAALIGLGDQPQMEIATVQGLLAAEAAGAAPIIVPSYRMRRGHPWLVRRELWAEIAALRSPQTARDFLNDHPNEIEYFRVDTPTVHQDLDTPEEYDRLAHD